MLKITGETRVFSKEINKKVYYSTTISNKNENGTYDKMYISIQFRKDVLVSNNTDIIINDGFLTFYKGKDETQKMKLVILDFELKGQEEETNDYFDDSELPF